ncbi:hypothetical protein DPMN_033873 [Dreissena polymorpha]|uniref:Uncharacterized protein n=1 Tax=Dreissena polymorpha TaxID=45954 RepID=A0A9D4M5P1_DREPO|nr:hypothetical protein DPMN_033873 [Dreissena polymorpha]
MPPVRRGSGRGRGNRARKAAAVQPRELKQPQMQSHEKPGNAEEKIPSIPSV